jgi:N-methylhydantoinase A
MTYVIGIDIGGTFTDAFAADETGRVAAARTPSTAPDFSQGFLAALEAAKPSSRTRSLAVRP